MKVRNGFVSNSSSSSFVISLSKLTAVQIELIKGHIKEGEKHELSYNGYNEADEWDISISDVKGTISGGTSMTNFDMDEYFRKVGIPDGIVEWKDDYWPDWEED